MTVDLSTFALILSIFVLCILKSCYMIYTNLGLLYLLLELTFLLGCIILQLLHFLPYILFYVNIVTPIFQLAFYFRSACCLLELYFLVPGFGKHPQRESWNESEAHHMCFPSLKDLSPFYPVPVESCLMWLNSLSLHSFFLT